MPDAATVAIPKDVIEPIVQARIQAAVVEALGKETDLIGSAVVAALSVKVDANGRTSQYSSDNRFTFLEAMANQYIRDAAKEALKEHLDRAKEQIKARVKKELERRSTTLATALVDGLARSIETAYGFNITVSLKEKS